MLSTGDVQNYLRKLQTELRFIKFRDVDYKSLQTGNPCEFLKIYHYLFLDYNPLFAKTLLDKCNCDFYGKTDSHFIDSMYKVLRDYFSYKPPITKDQFFTTGFAERKLQMACDVITLVRQECKEINLSQQPPKRTGSASARSTNSGTEKKRLSSNNHHHSQIPNTFQPLRDMSSQIPKKKVDHDVDEFASIDTHQQMENWFDEADFHSSNHQGHAMDSNEGVTSMTIHRLEEQIQMLRIKVEDINARLENVTSVLQETHSGNSLLSGSDLTNFNARLVIIENELAMLRRKTPQIETRPPPVVESKPKQTYVPQGILVDSDEEKEMINSYAIEEPIDDIDVVGRARSLLENAEQCNRDLLQKIQIKS